MARVQVLPPYGEGAPGQWGLCDDIDGPLRGKNQSGKRMWTFSEMSLARAAWLYDAANIALLCSLIAGGIATFVIVRTGNVKEHHWDIDRMASSERIAQLNNETARLRDAQLANVQAGRANALATQTLRTVAERIALAQGLVPPGTISEAARSLQIISKVAPFAGKQFDAVVTSSNIELEALLYSIRYALKAAGWIEVDRSDGGEIHREQSSVGGAALVSIHVDASKPELWEAAQALASALNAEGIEALANQTSTPDASNANAIQILVGPKVPCRFRRFTHILPLTGRRERSAQEDVYYEKARHSVYSAMAGVGMAMDEGDFVRELAAYLYFSAASWLRNALSSMANAPRAWRRKAHFSAAIC
jgi:hypothetical protein